MTGQQRLGSQQVARQATILWWMIMTVTLGLVILPTGESRAWRDLVGAVAVNLVVLIFFGFPLLVGGVKLGRRVGIRLLFLGQEVPANREVWRRAIGQVGLVVMASLLLMMVGSSFVRTRLPGVTSYRDPIDTWYEIVVYGCAAGVLEEIVFRLFLLSVLLWVVSSIITHPRLNFWVANLITAALFSLAHTMGVGTLAAVGRLPEVLASRFGAGLLLGWLVRRDGLEAAIVGHAATDLTAMFLVSLAGG